VLLKLVLAMTLLLQSRPQQHRITHESSNYIGDVEDGKEHGEGLMNYDSGAGIMDPGNVGRGTVSVSSIRPM